MTTVDALQAGKLMVDRWKEHRVFCSYCLVAAQAVFAILPLVLPEAQDAWENVESGDLRWARGGAGVFRGVPRRPAWPPSILRLAGAAATVYARDPEDAAAAAGPHLPDMRACYAELSEVICGGCIGLRATAPQGLCCTPKLLP